MASTPRVTAAEPFTTSAVARPPRRRWHGAAILAGFLLPCTAWANAGTALMWASALHLVIGNAVIGIAETVLLVWWRRLPYWRSLACVVLANYASAWVGGVLLTGGLADQLNITLSSLRFWFYGLVAIAFAVTLLIEWPFYWFAGRPQKVGWLRTFAVLLPIHLASYGLLAVWYGKASVATLLDFHVGSPALISQPEAYALYYLDPAGAHVWKAHLDGSHAEIVHTLPDPSASHRLWLRRDAAGNAFALLHRNGLQPDTDTDTLVSPLPSNVAPPPLRARDEQALDEHFYGPIPTLTVSSPWTFDGVSAWTGAIRGKRSHPTVELSLSLETPFVTWWLSTPLHVDTDRVVFQLGRDQICLLLADQRTVVPLVRGKNPVVVPAPRPASVAR